MAYTSRCNYTKTDVVNMALSQLGSERLQVVDIAKDSGKIPDIVNESYQPVIEEILCAHPWNNVTRHSAVTVAATNAFGFKYKGALPQAAQRLWYVFNAANNLTNESLPFVVIGRDFYTDAVISDQATPPVLTANIAYTVNPRNVNTGGTGATNAEGYPCFDPHLLRCIYTLLAARIATAITGNYDLESVLLDEYYNIVLPDAIRTNNLEGKGPFYNNSENEIVKLNTYTTFEVI